MAALVEKVWYEKYRPQTIGECILPVKTKEFFEAVVKTGDIPSLLLQGDAGCGKTTVARALCKELGRTYIFINASESGNIDTLRTTIRDFASSISLDDNKKVVILDEADYLSNATQPALRGFIEEFSANCSFILTCNFKEKIIEPLQSRCSLVSFNIPKEERSAMAKAFMQRVAGILKEEGVSYDNQAVVQVLKKHFPDYRRILNELQKYSMSGNIDMGIMEAMDKTPISEVMAMMKKKEFGKISDWVDMSEVDERHIITTVWNERKTYIKPDSFPALVMFCQTSLKDSAFVQNPKINLMYFFAQVMSECSFV